MVGAAEMFRELLEINLRTGGPDHSRTLGTRANLAYWAGRANDPDARAAFERSLAENLRVHGADHPSTRKARQNLEAYVRKLELSRSRAGHPRAPSTDG